MTFILFCRVFKFFFCLIVLVGLFNKYLIYAWLFNIYCNAFENISLPNNFVFPLNTIYDNILYIFFISNLLWIIFLLDDNAVFKHHYKHNYIAFNFIFFHGTWFIKYWIFSQTLFSSAVYNLHKTDLIYIMFWNNEINFTFLFNKYFVASLISTD